MNENPYSSPCDVHDAAPRFKVFRIVMWIIGVGCTVIVVGALLLPAQRRARPAAARTQCKNNLKQIGLALANYNDVYGSFPPPYTIDADGNRLHSWRTLLLPFMDQTDLYKRIDLSKPWNDPVNQEVFETSLPMFRCPNSTNPKNFTSYLAVVSDESCFTPGKSISYRDITDGSGNTIMVVEASTEQSVPWMSPQDFDVSQFLSIKSKTKIHHTGGLNTLLADGTVRFISSDISKETLQALITRAAKDAVGDF